MRGARGEDVLLAAGIEDGDDALRIWRIDLDGGDVRTFAGSPGVGDYVWSKGISAVDDGMLCVVVGRVGGGGRRTVLADLRSHTFRPLAEGCFAVVIPGGDFVGLDAEAHPSDDSFRPLGSPPAA